MYNIIKFILIPTSKKYFTLKEELKMCEKATINNNKQKPEEKCFN